MIQLAAPIRAGAPHAGIAEVPAYPVVPIPPVSELPERALLEPELQLRQQIERLAARAQDLRRGTLYETLSVLPGASLPEIQSAYAAKAKEHHPHRLGPNASAESRNLAEEIFGQIVQAHEVLTDPVRRAQYDLELRQGEGRSDSDDVARILAAEERFREGEELLKRDDAVLARAAFADAARLYPDEAEFHACLGWATWLASARDIAGESAAEVHLARALQLNSRLDRAYVFRGNIEKACGRLREAEAEFEKALTCNPACTDALRELKLSRR
jgi:curved DNA-binding protein CbpA